jgi:hypothetical protein
MKINKSKLGSVPIWEILKKFISISQMNSHVGTGT